MKTNRVQLKANKKDIFERIQDTLLNLIAIEAGMALSAGILYIVFVILVSIITLIGSVT